MKKLMIGITLVLVILLSACSSSNLTAEIEIGHRTNDDNIYYEDLLEFKVGTNIYTRINVELFTDKNKEEEFKLVIELENTDQIEFSYFDGPNNLTSVIDTTGWNILTTTLIVSENTTDQISYIFKGISSGVGTADIKITIYNSENEIVLSKFSTLAIVD